MLKCRILLLFSAFVILISINCSEKTPSFPGSDSFHDTEIGPGKVLFKGDIADFDFSRDYPENIVLCLESREAYRSKDAGNNWEILDPRRITALAIDDQNPDDIYMIVPT